MLVPSSGTSRSSKEKRVGRDHPPRHPLPTEKAEEGIAVLQESAEELIDGLEEDSTELGDAQRTTLTLAKTRCLLDPRAAIFPTWDAWVNAMQVGSAVFAAATTTEGHVRCRIAHKDRTLQATGPQWYVTPPAAWINAFYLAVVCREKDRISALCHVPVSLLRENGSRFEEHHYAWIETLQAYWRGGPGSRPEAGGGGRRHRPAIRRRSGDGEQAALPAHGDVPPLHPQGQRRLQPGARQCHQVAQGVLERGKPGLPGFRFRGARPPLAMVCFAYDAGMPIEVESDYLPAVLIKRNWCGEFPPT